jgi:hypothetical protein
MKDNTGNFTRRKFATPPMDFRALATGCGQTMHMSEDSGEARRAKIMANPSKLSKAGIACAPTNEGWQQDPADADEVSYQPTLDAFDEPPEPAHPWRRG